MRYLLLEAANPDQLSKLVNEAAQNGYDLVKGGVYCQFNERSGRVLHYAWMEQAIPGSRV